MRHCSHFLLLLLIILGLAGCVVPKALIVKAPAAPINAHLQAALALSPASTEYFAFTNWEIIKQIAGVTDLTSADSMDERLEFVLPLTVKEQALASGFGMSNFLTHAEMWGWDSTDLLWEANLTVDGPPIFALRFGDDFDFAPVFTRLDERGYSVGEVGGATLYSHEMDMSLDWLGTSEFAILNIAFLEDEKIFILSSAPDSVTAVLDAISEGATLANLPAVHSVAAALGDVGAAILSPLGCEPLDAAPMLNVSPEVRAAIVGDLDKSGISGVYDVFGLGYRVEMSDGENVPLGILVHHYPIASQAEADLGPRRLVAETANSLANNAPYAELFEVVDGEVKAAENGNANLILKLHALERPPQLFFTMFYRRDLLFSTCGDG